jgi:hypothetical protein
MSRVDTTRINSSQAAAREVEPSQVQVLAPNHFINPDLRDAGVESPRGKSPRGIGETFANNMNSSTNTNSTNNQTQVSPNQDQNDISGENAHENIIGKARTFVGKIGTTLMWGAGGVAALLYLGLGWKLPAMIIATLGVGAGYFLTTKLAKVGVEKDHHQQIVDAVKAMNLPTAKEKEILESLQQMFLNDAYKNPMGSSFNNSNNQPSTQPA